ncbi:hypothetical protein ACSNOI_14110 [Actinomadura kijaniata]|uniref:acyl-CoA-like ligand-binding transcription factor n=1 Tax=Actinomadura kijaniata TaxID=46161 RepID=UPI003F1AA505
MERQAQWRDGLAAELTRRLGLDPATDLYPPLAAGMALTAFDLVLQRWSDSEGAADPAALTDRAFATIAPALDGPGTGRGTGALTAAEGSSPVRCGSRWRHGRRRRAPGETSAR